MFALPVLQPHALARQERAEGEARTGTAAAPRSVRLSLTDRCDLACIYCRPHRNDGYVDEKLDLSAWQTMAAGLVRAGVRRVRLTGGEPLLHPNIVDVIRYLDSLGIDDLALTTNATQLARLAIPLREAGLRRINVSLDTLDAARFTRMTRGGRLDDVLAGIEAARAVGFDEIKLNAVVVRGENDEELESLVTWSWARGIVPRLLEVMKIGEGANLAARVVAAAEMRARLGHLLEDDEALPEHDRGPAKYVAARPPNAGKKVGFITGTTDTYCAGCDRLRVSATGVLRPCLATNDGVSASLAARAGSETGIAEALVDAWAMKPDGESWRGCAEETASNVSIRAIGG